MTLPNDTTRCLGETKDAVCPKREQCTRYVELDTGLVRSQYLCVKDYLAFIELEVGSELA